MDECITEEWLKSIGFKWHQFDRQPNKQWLLWLGCATHQSEKRGQWSSMTGTEDIGLEVTPVGHDDEWFCWFRSDVAGRYSRFLHIRHLKFQRELIGLIEAIAGMPFDSTNAMYGSLHCARHAAAIREMDMRRDIDWMKNGPSWRDIEKDDTRGGALPEHMEAAEKSRRR